MYNDLVNQEPISIGRVKNQIMITVGCTCARHFPYTRGWMQMFFYCHMIYSPETDRHSKTWIMITIYKAGQTAHDSHMIRTLCIRVSWCRAELVSHAFWHLGMSNLLHCLMLTVCFPHRLAGRVPLFPLHSRWPHFPQGPRTFLSLFPLQHWF